MFSYVTPFADGAVARPKIAIRRVVVEITGITDVSEGATPGTAKAVNFTWTLDISPFPSEVQAILKDVGKAGRQDLPFEYPGPGGNLVPVQAAVGDMMFPGTARFRRYDDGWRFEGLD